jgi:hypothetical protein
MQLLIDSSLDGYLLDDVIYVDSGQLTDLLRKISRELLVENREKEAEVVQRIAKGLEHWRVAVMQP